MKLCRPRHKGRFVKSSEQSKSEETLEKAAEEGSDTKEKPMSMATVAASIGDDITQPKAEPEDNIPKDTSVEYPSMGKAWLENACADLPEHGTDAMN